MCGIYALITTKPIDDTKYRRKTIKASHKLRHRGPDGTGYHQTKYGCFSHMRLSIIDPQSGIQPLTNQNESVILCVNGEIFNYKDLKKEFTDYKYKTGSDCEVILAIYEYICNNDNNNNNTNVLSHTQIISLMSKLNGQYSFILHDTKNDMVFVARDPFGITQSYYGMDKYGYVHIASEIKALDKCVNVSVMPCGSYLYFDAKTPLLKPINFFMDTKYGEWSGMNNTTNNTSILPYLYQAQNILNTNEQDLLLIQIRETFEKAVIARLMSDVPFGILLSGGLDSSLVASVAVKYIREHPEIYGENAKIHTFSIGDVDSTDLPYARMVADFLGTTHHEIGFDVEEGINSVDEIVSVLETYDITTIRASTPHYLMSRKIKSMGFKMVL